MADSALERNKQNVMAFYDLMFNDCRPAEAVDRVIQEESANGNGMF
jgi:predicted SnoaL-like aldol condensation-catalyzing enzyme